MSASIRKMSFPSFPSMSMMSTLASPPTYCVLLLTFASTSSSVLPIHRLNSIVSFVRIPPSSPVIRNTLLPVTLRNVAVAWSDFQIEPAARHPAGPKSVCRAAMHCKTDVLQIVAGITTADYWSLIRRTATQSLVDETGSAIDACCEAHVHVVIVHVVNTLIAFGSVIQHVDATGYLIDIDPREKLGAD